MATIPINIVLPNGIVAVYGQGATGTMPSGNLLPNDYRYGTVYHIWAGGQNYVYGGDVVFWKDGSEGCRLVTTDTDTFTLVPARLVTKDNPPVLL